MCAPGLSRPQGPSSLGHSTTTYLPEGALGLQEGDDDEEWDTGHGGESQEPSNEVAPRRVHVDVVVFERCVLAQGEDEGGLKGGGGG